MQKLCFLGALLATLGACSAGSNALVTAAPTPVTSSPVASAPVASAPVASAPVASGPVASAPVTPISLPGVPAVGAGPPPAVTTSPSISGTPSGAVVADRAYSFTPTAADTDGGALTFSVQNAPSWATFNRGTGELSGTPTVANVGIFSKIILSVSDGTHIASLAQFSIAVTEMALGHATLTWVPPTQNTDGTALTNLAGYRIYYGNQANELTQTIQINTAGTTDYVIGNLTPGIWYFAISAFSSAQTESAESVVQNAAVL
jgi:hypothetical protein